MPCLTLGQLRNDGLREKTSSAVLGNMTVTGTALLEDSLNIDGTLIYSPTFNRMGISQTSPVSQLDITKTGIGVTQSDTYGLRLSNTTAATVGAQQYSPPIIWRGNGWKTDAVAGSMPVEFMADVRPVQGAAAPTGYWGLYPSVNDAAYSATPAIAVTTAGNVGIEIAAPVAKLDVNGNINIGNDNVISLGGDTFIRYWNGNNAIGIGKNAGSNIAYSNGFGYAALHNNTGVYSNGFGYAALQNNTGAYSSGFGFVALQYNTGAYSNGFGSYALQGNAGAYSNGFGYGALYSNIGAYSDGFGNYALYNNTGASSNGFGYFALYNNTGAYSSGFGNYALQNNTGASSNGFGYGALRYNQNEKNIAIGNETWSVFAENISGNKTFDNTDINISTDRITINAHGFGVNAKWINLKYTQGTSPITGLTNGNIYQAKIIDANTVGMYELISGSTHHGTNITDAGSGTGHIFTPQYDYENSIAIGANVEPTASNQIILGNDNVTQTILKGNANIGAATAVDAQSPDLIITGDADADVTAFTTEALTTSLIANANPTLAKWNIDVTQAAGIDINTSLAVTGTLSGETGVTLDVDAAIVLTAAMCRNAARFNNDADVIDYTLPAAEAGLVVLFYDIAGGVITVDPYDVTDTIYLNGVSVGAGDAIDSPGAVGDFIALMAIDATRWISLGRNGVWIDGGVD